MKSAIRLALADVERLVGELDEIRAAPPRPFTVTNNSDRLRLGRLLGLRREDRPPIGDHSPVGYSQTFPDGRGGTMTTTPPEPGDSSVEGHVQASHWFLEHARVELEKGNLLQASEKVWGATAHALKAIAAQRGWRHRSHATIFDIGEHLGREFDREERFRDDIWPKPTPCTRTFTRTTGTKGPFGWPWRTWSRFVGELDEIRAAPPRPYTVRDNDDRLRLGHLLGLRREDRPPIGDHSPVGYSQTSPNDGSLEL